jgi:uncharacterized protein (DUF924 family)
VTPETVHDFWFEGEPDRFRSDPWFRRSDAFDEAIRARFAPLLAAARDGALSGWTATPRGTLALLLVLDQFPRNLHRGSPLAFASDAKAREVARAALAAGIERGLTKVERAFLYLPFEHSEHLADQDASVALFTTIADHPEMPTVLDYALRHRDVIRRFGRFPHRNATLGRLSTPEEEAYLAEPGAGF